MPSTTIFIDNKTGKCYYLMSGDHKLAHVKKHTQYSFKLPLPHHNSKLYLVQKSNDKNKVSFSVDKNGQINKYCGNSKVNVNVSAESDQYMALGSDRGTGTGIVWDVKFCTPVWSPSKSKLTLSKCHC